MSAHHQMECKDTQNPAKHGKDIADGEDHAVDGMVKNAFNNNNRDGTQNLVHHLASTHPRPNTERQTRYYGMRGLYTSTRYIYMFLDEGGMDEKIVAVKDRYNVSSKDQYY